MFANALLQFAQTVPETTVPTTEPDLTVPENMPDVTVNNDAVNAAATGIGVALTVIMVLGFVNFICFIFALIHLIKHDDVPNRVLWIVLSLLIPFASLIYLLGPRRSYNKKAKAGGQHPAAGGPVPGPQTQPGSFSSQPASNQPFTSAASSPSAAGTVVGVGSAPQPSTPTLSPEPTPVTPPTMTPPATQVAAAPENPVQVPPAPPQDIAPAPQPVQDVVTPAPIEPQVVQPQPPVQSGGNDLGLGQNPQDNNQFPPSNQV